MKTKKVLLPVTLCAALLVSVFGSLSVFSLRDKDSVINPSTVSQWTVRDSDPKSKVTAMSVDGGVNIKFEQNTVESTIATKNKLKWDGLHVRLENLQNGTATMYLSGTQHINHSAVSGGMWLDIWTGGGNLQHWSSGANGAPMVFSNDPAIKDKTVLDIFFKKTASGGMEITVNGSSSTSSIDKAWMDANGFPEEIYLGFSNTWSTGQRTYNFNVPVLHGADQPCHHGEAVVTEDHDAEFNAPTLASVEDVAATTEGKFDVTDKTGGGLHFDVTDSAMADRVSLNRLFDLDGLHFRVENLAYDPENDSRVFTFIVGMEKNVDPLDGPVASNHSYVYTVYLDEGMFDAGEVRGFSHYASSADWKKVAGSSDTAGDTFDVKFYKSNDGYFMRINGKETQLITQGNYDAWSQAYGLDLSKVYLSFSGGNIQDGARTVEQSFNFDLTVLHDKTAECYADIPTEIIGKVRLLEEKIDGIGTVTLAKEPDILAARALYEGLTERQLQLFDSTKLAILTAAEEALEELKEEQAGEDQKKADAVIALIDAIGNPVTLISKPAILAAEEAYEKLTAAQKALVTNYEDLLYARTVLNALEDDSPDGGTGSTDSTGGTDGGKQPATGDAGIPAGIFLLAAMSAGVLIVLRRGKAYTGR